MGGDGLRVGGIRHEALESLILQSAGLSAQTLRGVATIRAAKLRHLEVWTVEDQERGECLEAVCPLCWPSRASLPGLQTLGVRSCGWLDELMEALRRAPNRSRLPQLRALDLSMGALTDRGLEALLSCPWLDTKRNPKAKIASSFGHLKAPAVLDLTKYCLRIGRLQLLQNTSALFLRFRIPFGMTSCRASI